MANLSIPARNFAIAHLEHWHDGWPDYSDGLIGTLSLKIGGLLEKFVSYDEVEVLIFVGFLVAIVVAISLNTIGNKSGVRLIYVGIGLAVAGGFSNQVEVLVFGHVTDFLFFWVPVIGPYLCHRELSRHHDCWWTDNYIRRCAVLEEVILGNGIN